MDSLARLLRRLWIFIRREKFRSELEEEMAFHREESEKDLRADGHTPDDALYASRRQFGNDTRLREQSVEIVGFRFESVLQDFRYSLRQLRRNPGFTCTAILILALGIGATVAIFAYVDAALIKPLPYENPSRLVAVYESQTMFPRGNLSYQDYLDWKKLNKVFSSFDAWTGAGYLLKTATGIEPARAARVTNSFFRTLGVTPVLGRDFTSEDDAPNARVVILSYGDWQARFGGRQDIIGQPVTLDDAVYTIIGILPRAFHFAPRGAADFWVTLHAPIMANQCEQRRGCHNLYGVARLKDGISVQTALADMQAIAAQLEKQYPDSNLGQGAAVIPLTEAIVGDIRPILLILLSGAGLLLLIACVNVASLLLVRSEGRKREIAVRGALGASPARLFRQFVTEGFALVLAASACGVGSAYWLIQLLLKLIPADMLASMPYMRAISLNARVMLFAVLVSLLAAVLFSMAPALRLSWADLRRDLAAGGRTSSGTAWRRLGSNLVIVELAIATVLLAGAGLLGKSFYRLLHVELGFQPDHLATIQAAAPDAVYNKEEQLVALVRKIISRIEALPGVKSAATSSMGPVDHNGNTSWIRVLGHPYNGEHNEVNERQVTPEFFTTLQTRLLRGRYFTEADDGSRPLVVIINQTLAKKYFPGEDPIGKKIGDNTLTPKSIREVVGVVADIREGALDQDIWPAIYEPYNQAADPYFGLIVRTSQSEQSLLPALAATIRQIDPNIGTINPETISQRMGDSESAWLHRSSAWLVGGFAALALLLGVVGLYGVIAYSVSQRTREIGMRMALGARRSLVYQLIMKESGWLVAIGIAVGLACSVGMTAFMDRLLFGVRSWDVSTLTAVAVVLALAALLATYLPARRAASVNPVEALRAE